MTKISFLLEILIVGLLFEDPRLGMRHFFAIAVMVAPVTSEICGATGGLQCSAAFTANNILAERVRS
jgi:hypothetical protein